MTAQLNLSAQALMFLADYESNGKPHLKAVKSPEQPDPNKVKYEIGFGHNSDEYFEVTADTVISPDKAYDLLKHDVKEAEAIVCKMCSKNGWTLSQHEFDALTVATFNGVQFSGASAKNTALALTSYMAAKEHGTEETLVLATERLKAQWLSWNKARKNGQLTVMKGLQLRRSDEFNMFINGVYKRTK